MIRVKVFGLKEILAKVIFGLAVCLIIYFVFSIFLKFIKLESRSFAVSLVEENINAEDLYVKGELNTKLLQNELGLETKLSKSALDSKENVNIANVPNQNQGQIQSESEDEEENDNSIKITENEKFLAAGEVKTWDRPKTYNVTELSSGKIQVGNCYITNYSQLKLNKNELSKVCDVTINDDTSILIFHTHTSEAYSEMGSASNFRTTNDLYNVVAVGNVLKENLLLKNFNVLHATSKHDTPSYNGAYKASLQTVESILKEKEYDIIIDLHRDALSGNINFRPTAEINGESAAKLMFVVGTNAGGLSHDGWMNNLKLALLIQNTANEMYPGLFRDLNLSKSRYNQQVSDGALILEVGATGNTLDEVKTAMKYLSNVLAALKN